MIKTMLVLETIQDSHSSSVCDITHSVKCSRLLVPPESGCVQKGSSPRAKRLCKHQTCPVSASDIAHLLSWAGGRALMWANTLRCKKQIFPVLLTSFDASSPLSFFCPSFLPNDGVHQATGNSRRRKSETLTKPL